MEPPSLPPFAATIYPNGTISNASAPIQVVGNRYAFTGDWNGALLDERSGSTIDGKNRTLGANGWQVVLGFRDDSNVSVSNITLVGNHTLLDFTNDSAAVVRGIREPNPAMVQVGACDSESANVTYVQDQIAASNASGGGQFVGAGLEDGGTGHLTLTNSTWSGGVGVQLIASRFVNLTGNTFAGAGVWLILSGVLNFTERGDLLNNSAAGIAGVDVTGSGGLLWSGNQFSGANDLAMLFFESGEVELNANAFSNEGSGAVYLDSCTAITLLQDNFISLLNSTIAIDVVLSSGIGVYQSRAYGGGTDLWATRTSPLRVENNSFSGAAQVGINLSEESHPIVTGNTVNGPGSMAGGGGLVITNSSQLVLVNNQLGDWTAPGAAAVYGYGLLASRLTANNLDGSYFGLHLVACFNDFIGSNEISNGQFIGNGSGLELFADGGLNVTGNVVQFDAYGMRAQYGGDSVFLQNEFSFESRIGVIWDSFYNVTFAHNTVQYDTTGFELRGGADFRMLNNDGSDPSGTCGECNVIYLFNDVQGVLNGNNLSGTNVGIGGSFVGNLTLDGNIGLGNGFLLLLGQAYNLSISRNIGSDVVEGIEVDNSVNVSLDGNQFTGPIIGGVRLFEDEFGHVNDTTIISGLPGAFGLELSASSQLSVTNNTLSNLSLGLEVDNSSSLSFASNTLGSDNASFDLLA
ncbi:MAG: right-handed parallel beta-helix repeat-containing protein, partial [Thermoplasmata archaeon]|nr:right-handed parallel beta-helix repeat-containing protein [Thermoplasmata archaeon]